MNKYKSKANVCNTVIYEARIQHNLSLEKLSNKLQLIGVTLYPNDLFLIEKGQRILKDFELLALCKVLAIDLNDLKNILDS